MKKTLLLIVTLTLILTACGPTAAAPTLEATPNPDTVVAEGHIKPKADANLTFGARGRVSEILVTEGQKVAKGDVLIRLDGLEQAHAALAAAQLTLIAAQQDYDAFLRTANVSRGEALKAYQQMQIERSKVQITWESVNTNNLQDQIDNFDTELRDAKERLKDANENLEDYIDLKPDNNARQNAEDLVRIAQADYNIIVRKVEDLQRQIALPRAALDAAIAAEDEAKRTYELSKDGPNPEKKALVEAQLNSAKAQAAAAQEAVANFELTAPFDGIVTDINTKLNELIGTEKYAVQVADLSAWYVETSDLTELEVVKVREGQPVVIEADALPGLTLNGKVETVSQSYTMQGGDVLYSVRIKLIDSDPQMRWGMTVQTTFNP